MEKAIRGKLLGFPSPFYNNQLLVSAAVLLLICSLGTSFSQSGVFSFTYPIGLCGFVLLLLLLPRRATKVVEEGIDRDSYRNEPVPNSDIPPDIWRQRERFYRNGQLSGDALVDAVIDGLPRDALQVFCYLHNQGLFTLPRFRDEREEREEFPPKYSVWRILVILTITYVTSLGVLYAVASMEMIFLKIISGASLTMVLWSVLYPSSAERFSTIQNDPETMITRAVNLIIASVLLIFVENVWVHLLCSGFIALFPLWLWTGFIAQFSTFLWWGVEVVLRYGLGMAGLASLDKNVIASVVLYGICTIVIWQDVDSPPMMIALFGLSVFVLGLTFNRTGVFFAAVLGAVSAAAFGISLKFCNGAYLDVELGGAIAYLVMGYLPPLACGPSSVLLGCMYFLKPHWVWAIAGLTLSAIIPPFILGSLWRCTGLPSYAKGALIVHSINRSFSEGDTYAIALVVARVMFEVDFHPFDDRGYSYLLALACAKKFMSLMPFFEFYFRSPRRVTISYWAVRQFPVTSVPISLGAIWSIMTGSPTCPFRTYTSMDSWMDILIFAFLPLASSPRPNLFWDRPRRKAFSDASHASESVTYASLTASLQRSLASFIKRCHLGMVSENSFFIFINEPAIALVHIVGINPMRVLFQVRGAEFRSTTLCHENECSTLSDLAHEEHFWAFHSSSVRHYWEAAYRPIGVAFETHCYKPVAIAWNDAFVSLTAESREAWLFIALCHIWFADQAILKEMDEFGSVSYGFLPIYNLFCEHNGVNSEGDSVVSDLVVLHEVMVSAFNGPDAVTTFEQGPRDLEGGESKLLRDAYRFGLLLLTLAAAMLAPSLDTELDEIFGFLEETDRHYAIIGPESGPFPEEKSLFSVRNRAGEPFVTFHRSHPVPWKVFSFERDVVRCLWTTDAMDCVFWGDDTSERDLIQSDHKELHNLIIQLSDSPVAYPVYVSEIVASDVDIRRVLS
jgi:hypothetical protein